ncbi:MAG: hypothetical protein E7I59_01135 [Phytobacter diazotrophicus]|nr:hypothetical protein [Phytobacter diazotrophicus]
MNEIENMVLKALSDSGVVLPAGEHVIKCELTGEALKCTLDVKGRTFLLYDPKFQGELSSSEIILEVNE